MSIRTALLTPAARRLQHELIQELARAAVSRQLSRSQAEAGLSAIMCDVWNGVEDIVLSRLPDDDTNPLVDLRREQKALENRPLDDRV
jgi:hypothetical protein